MDLPVISPRALVYENQRQKVYRVTAQFSDFSKEFFVTNFGARAGMVAVKDGLVLLVRQYRLLINASAWEIPGGRVDDDETPSTAAIRECLEETGVRCINSRPLVFLQPGLDTVENPTHVFYTDEIAPDSEPQHRHANEIESWEWLPVGRCIEMIFQRAIVDSLTISALLAYQVLSTNPDFDRVKFYKS